MLRTLSYLSWRLESSFAIFSLVSFRCLSSSIFDFISKRGQLNIIIGDDQSHNDGYGTDTVKILIKYGFERLGLNSIQLGVNAENIKGLKAYKKAGFKKEGQRRQYIYTNNKFNDMIVMSILASEYK